jgi:hypothetical protein
VHTVNLAAKLSIDPTQVPSALGRPLGSAVKAGEEIASARSLFGLVKNTATAPVDGTLESVSSVTGQLILREPPIPVEVQAYVRGTVAEVLMEEGVIVESHAALLQGIFGVGGETFGPITIAGSGPDQPLERGHLKPEHRGAVVVGGAHVSHEVLMQAREFGVAAVVVGGFDDHDLRQLLGRDLGVAITGSEDLGFTLVLTEGFGRIPMADRSWRLLNQHAGRIASVSGATQIRAGVMRPEILIPLEAGSTSAPDTHPTTGLEVGSLVRIIRQPYFGRIARVVDLPPELQGLESEAQVRVLVAELADGGESVRIPRANVELIAS